MPNGTLLPVTYDPANAAQITTGLMGAVEWVQDGTEPTRFIDTGVKFRYQNVLLDGQFGVWGESWCGTPATDKVKDRTTSFPEPFTAMTVYGFDHNYCGDLNVECRAEVVERARHALDLNIDQSVETTLSARLITDAGAAPTKTGILATVSYLEGELAKKGLMGFFHVGAQWAAYATEQRLNIGGRTPLGHRWVYGGGYVAGLGAKIIVTTQPYGWRGPVSERSTIQHDHNQFIAIAEQTVVVGYEAVLAAATIG